MVQIPTNEWIQFVSDVRSRLTAIETKIESTREMSSQQHATMAQDFLEMRELLSGNDDSSFAKRVRSLEDSRTKMNGVQLGISAAFSVVTAAVSWLLGHPGVHVSWNFITDKASILAAAISDMFDRKS